MPDKAKHPVETSRKTIRVLDTLRELSSAGVTELANELEMNKSTVHNHLSTLEAEELVVQNDSKYELGLRLLEFGGAIQSQNRLYRVAESELESLARKSEELATLSVEEHGRNICLACERGDRAVNLDIYPGYRRPIHLTAQGKAILAHLPSDRVDRIIARHGLDPATRHSVTTREDLYAQLDTVRERGYAIDEGEFIEGLQCVSAPILSADETVLGAIGISAPTSRSSNNDFLDELPELVQSSANVIQINLTHR